MHISTANFLKIMKDLENITSAITCEVVCGYWALTLTFDLDSLTWKW